VYFRSRDKHGGHLILSAVSENPMLHANFSALSSTESDLLPIEVLHCGNRKCRAFCYCDLDLDPVTLICQLDPYPLKYRRPKVNLLCQGFRKLSLHTYIHSDRQTDTQMPPKILPRHFTGGNIQRALQNCIPSPVHVQFPVRDIYLGM